MLPTAPKLSGPLSAFLTLFAVAALLALSSPCAIAAAHKPAAKASKAVSSCPVPFRYDPILSPYLVVSARLNGHALMLFVVDTSLTGIPVVLDPWAAKELHLSVSTGQNAVVDTQAANALKVTHLQTIAFSAGGSAKPLMIRFDQTAASAAVMDLSVFNFTSYSGPRIAGVMGADFFRNSSLVMQIDFLHKQLTLYPGKFNLHFGRSDITLVPLEEHEPGSDIQNYASAPQKGRAPLCGQDSPEIENRLFYVSVKLPDRQKRLFILDTSSPQMVVRDAAALQLPTAPTAKQFSEEKGATGLVDAVQMPTLQVGSFAEPDVTVGDAGPEGSSRLGLDFLSRFSVFVDFVNKSMLLQRRTDYGKCFFRPGSSGISLKRQGDTTSVAAVSPNSPVGVQIGDTVTAVDGQALSALSLTTAQRLLDGFAGQPAVLSVQHASGDKQVVRLVRGDVFQPYRSATMGVKFAWVEGSLLVWQISEKSPLAKELEFNDDVTELNGQVADLTASEALSLLNAEGVSLQVWRDTDKTWHEMHLAGVSTEFVPTVPQILTAPPPAGYRWQFYPNAGWAAVPK